MTLIYLDTYHHRYSSPENVNSLPESVVAVVYPVRTKAFGMGLGASLHKYQHVAYGLPCTGPTVVSAVAILIRVCHDCLVFCGARVFLRVSFRSRLLGVLLAIMKGRGGKSLYMSIRSQSNAVFGYIMIKGRGVVLRRRVPTFAYRCRLSVRGP